MASDSQPDDSTDTDSDSGDSAIPPQQVIFECLHENCRLEQHAFLDDWTHVREQVAYYCEQGHDAVARFPKHDDRTWPPTEKSPDSSGDDRDPQPA